jgi:hypothetical protein
MMTVNDVGQLAMHVATLPGAIAELSTRPGMDVRAEIPRPQPAPLGVRP